MFISLLSNSQTLCSTATVQVRKTDRYGCSDKSKQLLLVLCTICMRSPRLGIFITHELLNVVIIPQKHVQIKSSKTPLHIITSLITPNMMPFSSCKKQKVVQFLVLCLYTTFSPNEALSEDSCSQRRGPLFFPSRLPHLPPL